MRERIEAELAIIRRRHPEAEYRAEGHWVKVPGYPLPRGWNRSATDTVFQIPAGFPGTPPYGIYVPAGLTYDGVRPENYTEPAPTQPPFDGIWGFLSWNPDAGEWRPTADPSGGSNLLNWVIGFGHRFQEGK